MSSPLYIYYHTHWDREWYLPFREYQHRLIKVVDDVLNAVERHELACFTLDGQTVLLEDYLALRPENTDRLKALVADERLSIGPWYVMPDEFLVSGESLIRNLQRGLQLSEAFGETTFTGYLPDTFGHSADIPMLLAHCGIDSAIVWRGVRPQMPWFCWQSLSGDSVLTYHLTEGYFQNAFHMGRDEGEMAESFMSWRSKVQAWTPATLPMLYPVGADHLGLAPGAANRLLQLAPEAHTMTPDRFMQVGTSHNTEEYVVLKGELRDNTGAYLLPGVFSSRMYLKQWNRRLEWRLTRQLEQLLSWQTILGQAGYMASEFHLQWQLLLLNHPHDSICGCSVDSVHRENENRFEQVDQLSQSMVRDAHHVLRQSLQPEGEVLILNLGDVAYTGVVEVQADYPLEQRIPQLLPNSQVLSEETILDESFLLDTAVLPLSENKALRRRSLMWVSEVPPHGVKSVAMPELAADCIVVASQQLENSWVRLQVADDGTLVLTDLKQGKEYRGMHALWRNVEQGDSYNAAPIPGAMPEQAQLIASDIVGHGPLRGALRLQYHFPQIDLPVETVVSLEAGLPRVTFTTRFTNNTPDQKIQVHFRANEPISSVVAEGHFAPVTRTYDPAYRIEDHMPAPKLQELTVQGGPIQRFIGFNGQTLITEGLTEYEVEGDTLKLTLLRAFGMLSSDATGVRGSHAGPPLPTPEGQCLNRPFEGRYAWIPGFEVTEAFREADVFYGSVYGFDRQGEALGTLPNISRSFFQWNNPQVQSTATVPTAKGFQVRLLNPTAVPQVTKLTLPARLASVWTVNLRGERLARLNVPELTLSPYCIQTLEIALE